MNVLLLGGEGFLGKNLQEELSRRHIQFVSRDIEDYDMSKQSSVRELVADLENVTHVVMLASKIGAKLFESDPLPSGKYNDLIVDNFITSLVKAAQKTGMKRDVMYYSSSEVFWSQKSSSDIIDSSSTFRFNMDNPRSVYSFVKMKAELVLQSLCKSDFAVSALKTVYPFNVVGKHQHRGVAYEMMRDALTKHIITYADDTVRTMTGAQLASQIACDAILKSSSCRVLQADNRCTVSMKMLAKIVARASGEKCSFVKMPPDKTIQYRQTSSFEDTHVHMEEVAKVLEGDLADLRRQVLQSI